MVLFVTFRLTLCLISRPLIFFFSFCLMMQQIVHNLLLVLHFQKEFVCLSVNRQMQKRKSARPVLHLSVTLSLTFFISSDAYLKRTPSYLKAYETFFLPLVDQTHIVKPTQPNLRVSQQFLYPQSHFLYVNADHFDSTDNQNFHTFCNFISVLVSTRNPSKNFMSTRFHLFTYLTIGWRCAIFVHPVLFTSFSIHVSMASKSRKSKLKSISLTNWIRFSNFFCCRLSI